MMMLLSVAFVSPRGRPAGFTLVELLVAMTVLLLLIGTLLGVFNATAANWRQGEARTDAYREARAAMALMARDLGATLAPARLANAVAGAPALAPSLVLDRHPDDPAASPDDPNEQAHVLTLAVNTGKSAECAVSYFCRWAPYRRADGTPDDEHGTWQLARRVVDSDLVFQRFKTASARPPPVPFAALFARKDAKGAAAPAGPSDDIASYVWDLQFRIAENLALTAGTAQPASGASGRSYGASPPYPDRLPAFVEIRFKALSASAAARLQGAATRRTWADPTQPLYRQAILPGAQQFVQRVPLRQGPVAITP